MEYEIVGHGHFGETWGIENGLKIVMGRPHDDAVWARLGKKVFCIKASGSISPTPHRRKSRKSSSRRRSEPAGSTRSAFVRRRADNLRVQTTAPATSQGSLSEVKVYDPNKKQPWQWKKIPGHERNEALDCRTRWPQLRT